MATSEIPMWWFRLPEFNNFGDELGPAIVEKLGYKVKRVPIEKAELITIGSILHIARDKAKDRLDVWGSGLISQHDTCKRNFNYLAVRGRLTANALGLLPCVPMGDPAILTPMFWKRSSRLLYNVGVVKHYVDNNTYPWADTVIDARLPVDEVVEKITQCRLIASSSLHGIIVAQAFDIPTMRIHSTQVVGGNFKWMDYLSGLRETNGSELADVLSSVY